MRARQYIALVSESSLSVTAQPPIADIVRGGWMKPGSLTRCLSSLRQTASRTICSRSSSLAPARSGVAQVGLVEGEQARAQAAVGGDADAVAVAAERLGDGVDEADPARGRRRSGRRARSRAGSRGSGSSGWTACDQRADLRAGQHLVGRPRAVGVERHELDEAHLVGVLARELGERQHLLLGEAAHRDRVDLDRVRLGEARRAPRARAAPAAARRGGSSRRSGRAGASRSRR